MTWVCNICGYETEADEAPAVCPVCDAENVFEEKK